MRHVTLVVFFLFCATSFTQEDDSQIVLTFVNSLTKTFMTCDAQSSPNGNGHIDVDAITTVYNSNAFQFLYKTAASLQTTVNGTVYLVGRRNGTSKETQVSEGIYIPVSPGTYTAFTKHDGRTEWDINPTSLGIDEITTTSSAFCVVPAYQQPQNDTCTGNCNNGNELFPRPCKTNQPKSFFDWEECQESPLLIDLGKNGFRLGRRGEGVYFDILGIGEDYFMQWVRPGGDEVFLVRDLNQNGLIDDGRELFGEGTLLKLQGDIPAPNGFVALGQFDHLALGGNDDGYITELDQIWFDLQLWHDRNADGQTQAGELINLEDMGLTRLSIVPRESRRRDAAGNSLRYWSWVQDENALAKYKMVDVFFRRIN